MTLLRLRAPCGWRAAAASWAAALTLGTAGCAPNKPPDPAAAFAAALGCYDVTLGPWTEMEQDTRRRGGPPIQASEAPPADDSIFYAIPPRIQLSDEPLGEYSPHQPAWSASAPAGALPVGRPHQTWYLDEDVRLALTYGDNMSGLSGTLDPDGEGWRGAMELYTDVLGITRWERQVTLSRVNCASPPPITDESVWLLPRSVELESGVAVTLGEPPPEGLPTRERPGHEPAIALAATGLFAGADTLVMVSRRGLVGMLQMQWLPPATPDALLARLSAAYGEPSVWRWPPRPNDADTLPEDQRPISGYSWNGRITEIHVSPSGRGGFRVSLSDPRIY